MLLFLDSPAGNGELLLIKSGGKRVIKLYKHYKPPPIDIETDSIPRRGNLFSLQI